MNEDINNNTPTPTLTPSQNEAEQNLTIYTVPKSNTKKGNNGKFPTIAIIMLIIILLACIIAVIIANKGKNVDMKESNVLMSKNYELSSKADFYTYGDNIFYSTKDSLRLLDQKGKEKWVDSYTMLSPVMLSDDNVVALAEENGTNVRVYNENGLLYNVTFNEAIVTFAVNGTGCLGTITKKGSDYELSVYSSSGERVYGGNYVAKDGIPMAMDISDDGSMFAVSFMNISNIKLTSNVLFYYINNSDSTDIESSNGMFTSVVCNDCMPFLLRFTADNRCISLMDNKIVFISPTAGQDTQKVEIPVGNRISYSCVNGDGTVALAFGEPLLNAAQQLEKNTVLWYDSKGNKVNEYKADKDITGLYPGEDITVIAMDRAFNAFKTKGGSLWQYTALQDTLKVLAFNGSDKMLAVTPIKATLAKVGKGNNLIEATTVIQEDANKSTPAANTTEAATQAASEAVTQPASQEQSKPTAEETTAKEATTEEPKTEQTTAENITESNN